MKDHGFLEVGSYIGSHHWRSRSQTPFKTHHNDYDMDIFLRISVGELWQSVSRRGFPEDFRDRAHI